MMNRRTFVKSAGVVTVALGISETTKAEKLLIEKDLPEREMQGIFWVEGSDTFDFADPKPIGKESVVYTGTCGFYEKSNNKTNYRILHASFDVKKFLKYRFIRICSNVSGIKCYLCDKPGEWLKANMIMSNEDIMDFGA